MYWETDTALLGDPIDAYAATGEYLPEHEHERILRRWHYLEEFRSRFEQKERDYIQ
jgi:hypothetical protein